MIRKLIFPIIALVACLLTGCKQDDWIDWKVQNELWLENNKTRPNIQTTATGLQYKVIYQGNINDSKPNSTGYVYVDYEGSLINGAIFDSGESTGFNVSGVVSGFAEGLKKMNVHGDYILYIPYSLGYGKDGSGTEGYDSYIPPYSTLIFTVHLNSCGN